MPYSRPTIQQIISRVKADVQGALESTAAFWRNSFERAATNAMAGVSHHLHGNIAWLANQIDPAKADPDIVEAVHGSPIGVFRKQAEAAQFVLSVTGATSGTNIPAGTSYQRSDNTLYTVDTLATVSGGGTATLNVTASSADAASNADVGTIFALVNPIAGVPTNATVTAITTVGSDLETPEAYLARVIQRNRTPPRGGAKGDYAMWALEVPGVTRSWEYPRKYGAGRVSLFSVNDEASDPRLLTAKLTEIANYLDSPGRQPTTVTVDNGTPALYLISFDCKLSPNTLAVQEAAQTELDALFLRVGSPGGMTVLLSQINEAISIAPGENDHQIIDLTGDITIPFGDIPFRGIIGWLDP